MSLPQRMNCLRLALCALLAFLSQPAWAAEPGADSRPDPALLADLVAANRILYDQGVVDGFGHVSVRTSKNPARFLMARSMAPGLVTAEDILEYDLEGNAIDAKGRVLYLERFIHSAIYAARPDVVAVVHSHSPAVIPFGVTGAGLRPLYHMSSFLGSGAPVFDIAAAAGGPTDMLVRTQALGKALAASLGSATVVLMRGHGSVAVGGSLPEVVFRAVYTEVNARLQSDAMRLGTVHYLDAEEAKLSMQTNRGVMGRAWELWKMKAMAGK